MRNEINSAGVLQLEVALTGRPTFAALVVEYGTGPCDKRNVRAGRLRLTVRDIRPRTSERSQRREARISVIGA